MKTSEKSWVEKQTEIVISEMRKIWTYLRPEEKKPFLASMDRVWREWAVDKLKECQNND